MEDGHKQNTYCQAMNKLLEKYDDHHPGVAVMAIKNGTVVYEVTKGLANMEHGVPITRQTVFNLASLSKQFTAMAVMLLEEKGQVHYDDSITDYFSELPTCYQRVTLRHLLHHRSGIPNYYRILEEIGDSSLYITNKKCFHLLQGIKGLLFEPGTRFDYSNSNYVLLALLIERRSGQTYGAFLKNEIFKPIDMKDSLVFDEGHPIVRNRAYGYDVEDDEMKCDYVDALTTGDGGVFSTLEDLFRWDQALYGEQLLGQDKLQEAFVPGRGKEGEKLEEDYGFGWSIYDLDGQAYMQHSGCDAGFRSVMTRFPQKQFSVILLSNRSDFTWKERLAMTNTLYDWFNDH